MKDSLKVELMLWAQYLAPAALAAWLHFAIFFASIPGLNVHEARLNYEPLMRDWLIVFASLGAVRIVAVLLLHRLSAWFWRATSSR